MNLEEKHTKTIQIRIEPELLYLLKEETERLDTDMSTYIRWCIRTALYLEDLNLFLRNKTKESK
jgi:hypothetical protein